MTLSDVHIDKMDYLVPGSCTEAEFRSMWSEFEWENKSPSTATSVTSPSSCATSSALPTCAVSRRPRCLLLLVFNSYSDLHILASTSRTSMIARLGEFVYTSTIIMGSAAGGAGGGGRPPRFWRNLFQYIPPPKDF